MKHILTILFAFLFSNISISQIVCPSSAPENYFLRLANHPSFKNLWTANPLGDGECQGVTHDNDNWYFTWVYNKIGYMFRVPVDLNIENNVFRNPRVKGIWMKQFPFLEKNKYWHWGDPDHYSFDGTDYIVVPITSDLQLAPIIAIFRAKDLQLMACGELARQESTGWCAVNPKTGILFTSEDFDYKKLLPNGSDCDAQQFHFNYPREMLRYQIPWNLLSSQNNYPVRINLTQLYPSISMLDANGKPLELYNMQGGEFTPSGKLLYISCGSGCCLGHGVGQQYALDGLYVFDTLSWRVSARSFNHDDRYPNKRLPRNFDYYYPLGCDGAGSWSPEGLTIWDLDNGRAPNIVDNSMFYFLSFTNLVKIDKSLNILETQYMSILRTAETSYRVA